MRPSPAAVLASFLLTASSAGAEPSFARLYQSRYGYPPSCSACHRQGGGSPLGGYGEALKKAGANAQGLASIEGLESDGDGFENGKEAAARSNPGDPTSTPASKGNWLDPANLIPKEVQAAFPGIRTYKPIDAILTAREVERAAALGVALDAKEENIIYLPLEGNEPRGAAIIVAAPFGKRPLFLMVATDRNLVVRQVVPISSSPPASGLYGALVGKSVKDLPAPASTASLDGAITESVRKAGATLYVRLKKE